MLRGFETSQRRLCAASQRRLCAAGQEVAPEELLNEFVPREAFVAETSTLLDSVMQEQRDIERAWKAG